MALRGAAARRYAQAVFELAREQGSLDAWHRELQVLNTIFGDPATARLLEDPKLHEAQQRQLLSQRLGENQVSPLALNLLFLLVRRNRLSLLPRIFEVFNEMYNKEKGIVIADVISAVPLDEAQQRKVIAGLSKMTGKTIQMRLREDPGILGGLVTRIGDELIDASVATRLSDLAERLA